MWADCELAWINERITLAILAEREACADVCEAEGDGHRDGFGQHCAAIIRMRSNVIGQGSAACGASPAPTGCASNGNYEERTDK